MSAVAESPPESVTLRTEEVEILIKPEPAPFGLTWGMPREDLFSPASRACAEENSYETICAPEHFPQGLPLFVKYILHFYRDAGLLFITATGAEIEKDPTGTRGRAQFIQLEKALQVRYPNSALTRNSYRHHSKAPANEFYSCLQNYSCGRHEATFLHPDGSSVRLRLMGGLLNTGRLVLEYQASNYSPVMEHLQQFIDLEKLYNIDATVL